MIRVFLILMVIVSLAIYAFTSSKDDENEPGVENSDDSSGFVEDTAGGLSALTDFASGSGRGERKKEEMVLFSYTFENRQIPGLVDSLVEGIQGEGRLVVDRGTSIVAGTVEKSVALNLTLLLADLDKPVETVRVEGVLVVANLSDTDEFSSSWLINGPRVDNTSSLSFDSRGFTVRASIFEAALVDSQSIGRLSVVSRPSINCELGLPARISSGREVGIVSANSQNGNLISTVEFRDVVLSLDVVVNRFSGGYRLEVEQQSDDLLGVTDNNGTAVPEIGTQELKSVLTLQPGEWSVVGGVVVTQEDAFKRRLSFLPVGEKRARLSRQELGLCLRVVDGPEQYQRPPVSRLRALPIEREENPRGIRAVPLRPVKSQGMKKLFERLKKTFQPSNGSKAVQF